MRPVFSSAAVLALAGAWAGPNFAAEPIDRIQGNWLGEWALDRGGGGKQTAQIVGLGDGRYQSAFTAYDGGEMQSETFRFLIGGTLVDGKGVFATQINLGEPLGVFEWSAEVAGDQLTGRFSNGKNYVGTLKLKRVEQQPDGLGARPLPGAIVLFDGKSLDHWKTTDGGAPSWKVADGAVRVARGAAAKRPQHLVCRETFGDAQIHLEFRTPYLPAARGTARGNSGVFVQGRYEIQILDSFGQPRVRDNFGALADDDSAGAIFRVAPPKENATLPPGEWQTLDITFQAPRWKPDGTVARPAEISVRHNGTLIHDAVKLDKPTPGAPLEDLRTPAGLILEDAGQPVEFRNIWLVRLDAP